MARPLRKITDKFDRRQSGFEASLKSLTTRQVSGFKRPGSRNPKKLRNK